MTLSDVMKACARARRLAQSDREHAGIERAAVEALAALQSLGVTPEAAHAAYMAQWLEFDDESPMHGAALAWIAARDAANLAATEGWHNPDGAHVSIYL